MFNVSTFIRSFFILAVFLLILFAATKFSPPIKQHVSKVLGTRVTEQAPTLPQDLQKDVTNSIEEVKKQGMETDLNDVVDAGSKINKVIADYHIFQKEIEKQVNQFFKPKENKQE